MTTYELDEHHTMSHSPTPNRTRRSRVAAMLSAVAAIGLALVTVGPVAHAAAGDLPPFEPDTSGLGGLVFYDAAGHVVTGGTVTDAPFAAYVQASGAGRSGDTKATLFGYLPKAGTAPGAWSGEALSLSTTYPNSAAPVSVKASPSPVVSLASGDETLATLVADFPNVATDAYQGLYQLRLKTSGPGQTAGAGYFSADIRVTGSTWSVVYSSLPVYVPLNPARVLETRSGSTTIDGLQNAIGFRAAGTVTEVQVAGRAGVPADASAAALNIAVTEAGGGGFITVFPCGSAQPTAANLNYSAGQTIANAVVAKIGTGGKVCIFNYGATHLVVDVNGYYPANTTYAALVPGRILESRSGYTTIDNLQNSIGFRAAKTVTEVQVAGRAGVPTDASAVVLNVAVTEAGGDGFITVFPCGSAQPTAANLNYSAGQTIANAVIAKIGTGGKVCIFNYGATHLVVDVNGYYPAASSYVPLVPGRVLESRSGYTTIDGQFNAIGFLAAGTVTQLTLTGRAGVPANASAVVLNVAVTEAGGDGFITVFPCGSPQPTAANLNYSKGQTIANAVIAKIGTGGKVCIFNYGATHLVVDVNGYYP